MIELIKNPNVDFMAKRKYAFIFSGLLVILGVFAIVQISLGKANLGVDFAGGTAVQIKFASSVSLHDVRKALEEGGLKDFDLQDLPTENKILIRVKKQEETLGGASELITQVLSRNFADKKPVVDSTVDIGPKVGAAMKKDALWAIVFATGGILVYIAWRFHFKFGVGAALAVTHDVLAMLGIFYLLNREMNLIFLSAVLTIAGYSLTDTVVVFDRIRENTKLYPKDPERIVINRSINEVLTRTIVLALTVFLSALALFLFGGEVIHDFSLAMLIGVVIGVYSSIFVRVLWLFPAEKKEAKSSPQQPAKAKA